MGSGALANMREHLDYDRIGHIVISHMHADHFADIIPLRYALLYGPRKRERKVELWLPPDGDAMLRNLCNAFADEGQGDFLDKVFDVKVYDPSDTVRLGNAEVSFCVTRHYIPTYALRYKNDDVVIAYSADTAPEDTVARHAEGATMFLCEATLLPNEVEHGMRGHCSALEAAQMAHRAGCHHLLLTHYPSEATQEDLIAHARMAFNGRVTVADDHARFALQAV